MYLRSGRRLQQQGNILLSHWFDIVLNSQYWLSWAHVKRDISDPCMIVLGDLAVAVLQEERAGGSRGIRIHSN